VAKVAVFCSSSDLVSPIFLSEAESFGRDLAHQGHTLIYGGAGMGMMGKLASGALMAGGEVIGVLPEIDFLLEIVQPGLSRKVVVPSMAERKKVMLDEADVAVALPGGLGTLDEIFEALVLKVTGQWEKRFLFLNVFDFWTPILEALTLMDEQRMIHRNLDELFETFDVREGLMRSIPQGAMK
jgi:uncharacterized protein (TIGR00730 family)